MIQMGKEKERFVDKDIQERRKVMYEIMKMGERIKIVRKKECEKGKIQVKIRKKYLKRRKMEEYEKKGFLKKVRKMSKRMKKFEKEMIELKEDGD